MSEDDTLVEIKSRDYWFKIVDFLQQNWALIEEIHTEGCTVYFFSDTSGVFDRLQFGSTEEAESALRRNGFKRFVEDASAASFLARPEPPFRVRLHPNGPIYSSGRFWR